MNPASPHAEAEVQSRTSRSSNPTRWLYSAAAALLLVLTFLGFQEFYLRGQAYPAHPIAPPIRGIIVAHGVSMTCWILLFMVQPLLIVGRNVSLHKKLGWLGAALAATIVFLGVRVPIATTRVEPDIVLWGLNRKQFTAIPIFAVLIFGAFVAVAVWQRRNRDVHRPMMLLATLSIIAAATDRITGIPGLYGATVFGRVFGPFFPALLIGGLFFIALSALTRSFNKAFAVGYVTLALWSATIMQVAPTHTWDRVISYLIR
jgi:hypothetical protein